MKHVLSRGDRDAITLIKMYIDGKGFRGRPEKLCSYNYACVHMVVISIRFACIVLYVLEVDGAVVQKTPLTRLSTLVLKR